MSNEQQPAKMWSGRFRGRRPAIRSVAAVASLRLAAAACRRLRPARRTRLPFLRHESYTESETARVDATALDAIAAENESGARQERGARIMLPAEDIHHFVELELVERVGDAGAQAAHRAQPQRTDRDGPAALRARTDRIRRGRAGSVGAGAGGTGARGRRCRDAELYAFAAG